MRKKPIGGQAVYEGVMIRAGDRYAVAIRGKNGEIISRIETINPLTKIYPVLGLPLLRGVAGFIETLSIGLSTLSWSIDKLEPPTKREKSIEKTLNYILAFVLALALFWAIPLGFSQLTGANKHAFLFNVVAGIIRVIIFLVYIWLVGQSKEIKRYFQYHGAEHKSIFTYEHGKELTPENVAKEPCFHPRCGTSFIFLIIVFAIFFFSIVDGVYAIVKGGSPPLPTRMLIHILLLPIMIGISWEILRKTGELYDKVNWVRFIIYPGLLFQRLTALEPSRDQIEVAIAALKLATEENNA